MKRRLFSGAGFEWASPNIGFPETSWKKRFSISSVSAWKLRLTQLSVKTTPSRISRTKATRLYIWQLDARRARVSPSPEENADGVIQGVDFLRDAALGKPSNGIRKAAVIGGGNVAIDAARTLVRLGADVNILYRRSRNEMPAFGEEVDAALDEGVKIQYLTAPVEVVRE